MPKVTWLGDVDNPNDSIAGNAFCTWGDYTFPIDVPVEVTDPHIIAKARTNRFFRLTEDAPAAAEPVNAWAGEPATGRVDYNAAADNPAPVRRSHKKKVVQP